MLFGPQHLDPVTVWPCVFGKGLNFFESQFPPQELRDNRVNLVGSKGLEPVCGPPHTEPGAQKRGEGRVMGKDGEEAVKAGSGSGWTLRTVGQWLSHFHCPRSTCRPSCLYSPI